MGIKLKNLMITGRTVFTAIAVSAFLAVNASPLKAQTAEENTTVTSAPVNQQTLAGNMAFWTLEKMQNAVPPPMPTALIQPGQNAAVNQNNASVEHGPPTLVPGWNPNSGDPQPAPGTKITMTPEQQKAFGTQINSYGSPPSNPVDYANYGKYQRFTMFGNYLKYPRSILGKLFFQNGGSSFVCSATVVNRSMVITAGHCVANGGASTFYSNWVFCPSYYKGSGSGAPFPSVGCWNGLSATTSSNWYANGSIDRDYACIVLATTGTVVANKVGNITGWAGMAYNYGSDEQVLSTGYPAGTPFAGYHIITTMAAEWYTVNQFAGDAYLSKYIGNDMTGGSSGGGWLLNWEHQTARYTAGDSSNITDPLSSSNTPYVDGVNSHQRCLGSCGTPTTTSGTFTNEMGSPMFEMNSGDGSDVESVYNTCLANGGA